MTTVVSYEEDSDGDKPTDLSVLCDDPAITLENLHASTIWNKDEPIETRADCDKAQDTVRVDPVPAQKAHQHCASLSQASSQPRTILNTGEPIKNDDSRDSANELTRSDSVLGQEVDRRAVLFTDMSTIHKKHEPIQTEDFLDRTVVASSRSLLKFRSKFEGQSLASVTDDTVFALCLCDVKGLLMHADTKDMPNDTDKLSTPRKSGMVQPPPVPQIPKRRAYPRRSFLKAQQTQASM